MSRSKGDRRSISRLIRVGLDRTEPLVEWIIRLCGWSAILFVAAIFFFVFREGAPVLFSGGEPESAAVADAGGAEASHFAVGEFLTSPNWRPDSEKRPQYGILALLAGTMSVTVLAMLLAVPLGLGAAVYVSEFSGPRARETLKIVIELLAAIPSVVWGFVGYMVIGPMIISLTGAPVGLNVLNGGVILALMSVPVIVSVGEDALRAVPDSYREAAIALGASRWEVVHRVLFPAAKSGLLAAVLLGVGRAIGETMAVLMATGHAVQIPHSPLDPVRTLTATIASELGEAVRGDEHYRVLFLIGIVLFAIAFAVNLTADVIVKGIRGEQND
jgi:phosphate transport system permease protein